MVCRVVARWVDVDGNKAAIGDDGLLLVEHGTGCPALCGAHWQGAGAGLFDILCPSLGGRCQDFGWIGANLSESSTGGFCDLRAENIVRERVDKLGMEGTITAETSFFSVRFIVGIHDVITPFSE